MTKKFTNQNTTYREELINSIESDFVFSQKPINRFKIVDVSDGKINLDKNQKINQLKGQINSIKDCNLNQYPQNIFLGNGNLDSSIMIISGAPGAEEEKSRDIFQGETGSLLQKMLLSINIKSKNVYSTYAINFRPPEDRKPTTQEIKRYSGFLKEHISIVDPKIVILFGSTAMESVTGINTRISNERGKWKEIILINKTYPLMVTFNPSYLIRFPENKKYSWEDLKKIKQKIIDLKFHI